MKLSIGIVGLPNVGKSTLFNLLTKQQVLAANYPFATIDPNVGVVPVPDERVDRLAEMSASKKKIPAVVEFYDIAGLVKGASTGEGLGNQFLSHIRETQAIVIVLRTFADPNVVHVENSVDPLRDLEIVNAELALKDLETVEKRLGKLEGEARTGDKSAVKNLAVLTEVKEALSRGELTVRWAAEPIVHELQLLTAKKQLYLLNGGEEVATRLRQGSGGQAGDMEGKIRAMGADYVVADLASDEGVPELIKKAYELLGLISFFTTGEDETRAWTIEAGMKAPQAAGVIHTDFEKKFIRAEVVGTADLLALAHSTGSGQANAWAQAKQKGKVRLEGKDYVVADGDVIVVRHG